MRAAPGRGMVSGWTLVAAAVLGSPALWLLDQGLASPSDVLIRFAIVLAGCVLVTLAIRAVWPVLAGPGRTPPAPAEPERAVDQTLDQTRS